MNDNNLLLRRISYYAEGMEPQTVTIELATSTVAILRTLQEKAEAQGITLDALLQPLIEENGVHQTLDMTPEERAHAFEEWASSHDPNTPVILDDSREAIYGDNGR
jgi:hypothetical protein